MISNRLEKNFRKLKPWAERLGLEAFRLYDRDIPEYPFIVDIYKDHAVIFDRSDMLIDAEKSTHLPELSTSVQELLQIPSSRIIVKRRQRQKGDSQYEKQGETNHSLVVREGPAHFKVNLHDYLDTGLFLDHRIMRERIRREAAGKTFLNLFCYTGAVSVFAALGGAQTTSVDMSQTYLDWAAENFRLNKIAPSAHQFVRADALRFLHEAANPRFDIVFLDPPTFSNSKKMLSDFDVERDQVQLVRSAMRCLRPNGVLYFSNNKRGFRLSPEIVAEYSVQDISRETIPNDFHDKKIHVTFIVKNRD